MQLQFKMVEINFTLVSSANITVLWILDKESEAVYILCLKSLFIIDLLTIARYIYLLIILNFSYPKQCQKNLDPMIELDFLDSLGNDSPLVAETELPIRDHSRRGKKYCSQINMVLSVCLTFIPEPQFCWLFPVF